MTSPGRLALILSVGLAAGCTPESLRAIDRVEVEAVDDLLRIEGEVCTDPPVATDFPVKILFVIDGSGSMQFVDAPARRALAVEEVLLRLRANPSVSFAIIRFNEADAVLTKPGAEITAGDPLTTDLTGAFTRDPAVLAQAVQELRVADSVTDYQGALSSAFLVLSQDMLQSSPEQLARTKYVVLFLSDGDPFPACCSERSQQNGLCERDDRHIFFCQNPNAIRQNPTQLPFLAGGEDYNQPYQIFGAARDIMELEETFGVSEIRIHTAFLFDPTLVDELVFNEQRMEPCYTIGGVNFVCPESARELLGGISRIGDGVFRDFSNAEEIDFLGFDQLTVRRENALKSLLVENRAVVLDDAGARRVDTDGDGLFDDAEFDRGLSRADPDSDGDGFSDVLEARLERGGFDPLETTPGCPDGEDRRDLDGDGLRTCEERFLRTSTELFDTDADGIPDGLEVRAGTDPARADALEDADLDGVRNGDEIRAGTSVEQDEGDDRPELGVRYRTEDLGVRDDGRRCYRFEVRNLRLRTPLARPGVAGSFGRNDVLVYAAQAPRNDPQDFGRYEVACVRARYVAPDFKDPLSGRVRLAPEDFHPPEALDPDVHCRGAEPPEAP
jgi:hypothetical protein